MALGTQIDDLYDLKQKKKEAEAVVKSLNEDIKEIERELIKEYKEQGMTMARGGAASATLTVTSIPQVEDWDAVFNYMRDNDAMYLLQRRVSSLAWRELLDSGELVPGTVAFDMEKISTRKL